MKITFLGTNGWYDTKIGNTVCTLIETKDCFIILDAGNGFHKISEHIPKESKKLIYLFISHFHLDHIIGLHILNKFNFRQGLRIYGQAGTSELLTKIIGAPYSMPLDRLPFKVDIIEMTNEVPELPFGVECQKLLHPSPTIGYRFEIGGKIIAYCADTGFCQNAIELGKNADLLIAECSYESGREDAGWPHLNPESAARVAKEAGAKRLALTHFDASRYVTVESRKLAEEGACKVFKDAFVAFDDTCVEL